MKKYALLLTTFEDWQVHRAGCADVERLARKGKLNHSPVPVQAESAAGVVKAYLAANNGELREMGYDESAFRIMPCCQDCGMKEKN